MSSVILSYFLIVSLVCASEDQRNVQVKAGDDVRLQCQVSKDASVILLEWNRSDLKSEGYVFFFRENRSYNSSQVPRFRGRVELSDPKMKDGNVSVILKNAKVNDSGEYECRVIISNSGHDETTPSETKQLIRLTVTDSDEFAKADTAEIVGSDSGRTLGKVSAEGNQNGHHGVAVSVTAVLLVSCFIGGILFVNRKRLKALIEEKRYNPAGGEDAPEAQQHPRSISS